MGSIFEQNVENVIFEKNKNKLCCMPKSRLGLGNATFEVIPRKCEDENEADGV